LSFIPPERSNCRASSDIVREFAAQPIREIYWAAALAFVREGAAVRDCLAAHNGTAAATEFQKFLDHRRIVVNFPLGALAHLGLARAYALSGDTAKEKIAYEDFLTLWKDADPDIPILKEAKTEYAKLQ
jgi:eukaryotic-like serine/threonine-protein kinase